MRGAIWRCQCQPWCRFRPQQLGGNPGQQGGSSNQGGSDNVTDVDYEEVK